MDISAVALLLLIGSSHICRSYQESPSLQDEQKRILIELLDAHDARIRPTGPNGTEGPVDVDVNMMLQGVTSMSDYDMDFGVQVILRQEWIDERLKYENNGKYEYLTLTDSSKIWTTDLFILNEKDGHLHKIMLPNTFIRIHPTGHVLYSSRLSLTLWCHMQLGRFPFDTQHCSIKMASYGYTTNDLRFHWKKGDPLQVSSNVNVMGFTLGATVTSSCNSNTSTGYYSCLKVDFPFKRDVKYYVLHTFLPSTVLVVVSWATFWMDRRAVVGRILLVLSTLFAMSSLATDIEAAVPHVSYVKAMDLWAGVCFTFLLAALLEFAVVNAASTSPEESVTADVNKEGGSTTVDMKPLVRPATDPKGAQDKPASQQSQTPFYRSLLTRLPSDPRRIDAVARLLFPTLFIAFVIVYFVIYCCFDGPISLE